MKTLTKELLAFQLDGHSIDRFFSPDLIDSAKANNLIFIYGASDDLLEVEGAIEDELDAYEGASFSLALSGELCIGADDAALYHMAPTNMILPLSGELDTNPRLIRAEWCPSDQPGLPWRISSNLPHAKFTIVEDDEPFCAGIVIDLDEVIPLSAL